jgi:multiple sugar transport system permease protein
MARRRRTARNFFTAMMFLAPNILGVLTFVVFPVLFAVLLAFTNWDLRLHNMYKDESLEFVGFTNFIHLLDPGKSEFWKYLGNTLFLMMGIPFAVGGSLFAAILLSRDTRGGGGRVFAWLIAATVLVVSCAMLAVVGLGQAGMVILLVGLACAILILGMGGGVTAYRTLFYTPHFTAGVATFLLWKKLYSPQTGPVNQALQPVLDGVAAGVTAVPGGLIGGLRWLLIAMIAGLFALTLGKLRRLWRDGELGSPAIVVPAIFLLLPTVIARGWSFTADESWVLIAVVGVAVLWQGVAVLRQGREFTAPRGAEGVGSALVLSLGAMVGQFVLLGFAAVFENLPTMASDGLDAPNWLTDYEWAKPAMMIVGLWGAIGSNNMLLYLAGLTNVPTELYEAADIDGASRMQRFWHVTWPQLAPTTFFILVMSTIYGLQGGFEMARTLTRGGPAGATTTLSYFVYLEGFETGRLAYAAATSWVLFLLVFSVTMFNWKFGNKYVND